MLHCLDILSFSIRSPTEGHLGCCQVLEVMNTAATNVRVQVFEWTYVLPLDKYHGV